MRRFRALADCKSAIRQIENLRYETSSNLGLQAVREAARGGAMRKKTSAGLLEHLKTSGL